MKPILALCAGACLLAIPAVTLAQPPNGHAGGGAAPQARPDHDRDQNGFNDRADYRHLLHIIRFCERHGGDGDNDGDDRPGRGHDHHNGRGVGHGFHQCHERPRSP